MANISLVARLRVVLTRSDSVSIRPNSISNCPNSEFWVLVLSQFGTVVSFSLYNDI